MAGNQKYHSTEDLMNRQTYFLLVLPAFFGILSAVGPEWSPTFALIWGGVMLLLILWAVISRLMKQYRNPRWRAFFGVVNGDLTALFILFPCWRATGEKIWVLFILLCAYVLCMVLTHTNRTLIFKSIYGRKKSRFLTIFITVSTLVVILTGGGSYGFTRSLQVFYGYNAALVIISFCLLPFSFIFIIIFHCGWYKVKNPDWHLDKRD